MTTHEVGDPPVLGAGEVHLWWARLPDEGASEGGDPHALSVAERERSEGFRTPLLRRRYVFRRWVVRRTLGAYLATPPAALRFVPGEHGKPRLEPARRGLCFNLSHTGNEVVLAVTGEGRELGVDVEALDRRGDFEAVARRVFTVRELDELEGLGEEPWRAAFLRGWTRKEAILKALGTGLLREPREVHVGLGTRPPGVPWRPDDPVLGSAWSLLDVEAPAGHAAAVAAAGEGWRVVTIAAPEPGLRRAPGG